MSVLRNMRAAAQSLADHRSIDLPEAARILGSMLTHRVSRRDISDPTVAIQGGEGHELLSTTPATSSTAGPPGRSTPAPETSALPTDALIGTPDVAPACQDCKREALDLWFTRAGRLCGWCMFMAGIEDES